ncbi:hypothetical protein AVEN_176528-1 [Araneus ventricosus]|uniref:Uncharacterized protein n=1 Tax=Araneus ventricosus TaxID=182803 RepID=A0A4Y2XAR1_ARAVE|nr:hypothetical protein AVEN_176528-1 [Araneus ventricosus]
MKGAASFRPLHSVLLFPFFPHHLQIRRITRATDALIIHPITNPIATRSHFKMRVKSRSPLFRLTLSICKLPALIKELFQPQSFTATSGKANYSLPGSWPPGQSGMKIGNVKWWCGIV